MKKLILAMCVAVVLPFTVSAEPIVTESTTTSDVTTNGTQEIISPPPSAISPSINTSNSDLCTVGVAGAVQTQILGISAGTTFTEENCVRLKNAKTLYDMGMKVAAVSVMCQDPQVFAAMMDAGTPCPYEGQIGDEARESWENNPDRMPLQQQRRGLDLNNVDKSTATGVAGIGVLLLLLLAL